MKKGSAFLVVGHSTWGKSETLKSLTDGDAHQRLARIGGTEFYVRHTSNDDKEREYLEFVRKLRPDAKPNVIAAFCPTFDEGSASAILEIYRERYDLFFFVIRHQYRRGGRIQQSEVEALESFGVVSVLEDQLEAPERAARLEQFVRAHIG